MSLSIRHSINDSLLEKVIINGDLSGLSSVEKVNYIKDVCHSLGLNPLTKPIQLIKFQGKELAYFTKDATEQLRKEHNISLKVRETKIEEGMYIVIVDAKDSQGREDSSTGVISISGLKGDALCNAMMKAETKAKRRATLSICGLGFNDESELETMKGAQKINIGEPIKVEVVSNNLDNFLLELSQSSTLDELEKVYKNSYKNLVKERDKEGLAKLIKAKDEKKKSLEMMQSFNDEIENDGSNEDEHR